MTYDIQIKGLNYFYNSRFKALDNIHINVPTGSIYGFLGPNGAGKSTTMSLIAGILPDTSKTIYVLGKPINKQIPQLYKDVGCMIESPALYSDLSGADNLKIVGRANKIPDNKIAYYMDLVGLSGKENQKVKGYSMGMRQRLAIAMALYKEPKILMLDEPVNGLDPNGMADIRQLLVRLNNELGVTIFISSHLLAEIEKMCTHVGIITQGQMRYEGTIDELKLGFEKAPLIVRTNESSSQLEHFSQLEIPYEVIDNSQIRILISSREQIPTIINHLVSKNIPIYSANQEGNLESWFLDIIK